MTSISSDGQGIRVRLAHAPGAQCSYYTVLKDFWSRTPWSLSNRYYVCYDDGRVKSFGRTDTPTSG